MKLTNQGSPRSGNCLSNEDGNIITLYYISIIPCVSMGCGKKNKVIFFWQNKLAKQPAGRRWTGNKHSKTENHVALCHAQFDLPGFHP